MRAGGGIELSVCVCCMFAYHAWVGECMRACVWMGSRENVEGGRSDRADSVRACGVCVCVGVCVWVCMGVVCVRAHVCGWGRGKMLKEG